MSAVTNKPELPRDATGSAKVEISGIANTVGEDVLKMFIENTHRSGGGPTKDIQYNHRTGTAVVTFQDKHGRRCTHPYVFLLTNSYIFCLENWFIWCIAVK